MILRNSRWLAAAVLLTLVGMPTIGHAQVAPPTIPGVTDPHLSPAQQARMNVRNEKFMKDRTALLADTKLTPTQKEAKYKALVQKANADVMTILTPAQQVIVKKNREAAIRFQAVLKNRSQAFQLAHKAEFDAGNALKDKLNSSLTPAQNAQIKAIKEQANSQLRRLDADKTMTRTAKQTQAIAIQQAAQAKIEAVLTPAQKAQATQLDQIKQKLDAEARTASGAPGR